MKINHLFGFESFDDFIESILGIKTFIINSMSAVLFAISSFITEYVYDTSGAVSLVVVLFASDILSGIYRSYIKNERETGESGIIGFIHSIKSSKLFRGFVILFFHIVLLALSWNMAKYSNLFFFLPGVIYGGILATQFISIIENLADSGVIKLSFFNYIKDKLILKNIFNKKEKKENDSNK